MDKDIKQLQQEMEAISKEIAGVQEKLDELDDEREVLLKRKKNLQRQAMFYIDKIENMKEIPK